MMTANEKRAREVLCRVMGENGLALHDMFARGTITVDELMILLKQQRAERMVARLSNRGS